MLRSVSTVFHDKRKLHDERERYGKAPIMKLRKETNEHVRGNTHFSRSCYVTAML